MIQLLTGKQAKEADYYSIHEFGMEGLVLMERAALAVTEEILSGRKPGRVFILCGMGNNGADGLAAARLMEAKGCQVSVMAVGNAQKATNDWKYQAGLLEKIGIDVKICESREKMHTDLFAEADVYVDALFGVGLNREVSGMYSDAINLWNGCREKYGAYGVAVDICSGVDASTGKILGTCIRADLQVTFGYLKAGQCLYPGADAAKRTVVRDIGFPRHAIEHVSGELLYCLENDDVKKLLGRRCPWGNKGTFGRVLVIAGSQGMAGAAYLSAMAAYRTGAGLVEIAGPSCNRQILQTLIPEAVLDCYPDVWESEDINFEDARRWIEGLCQKAKAVVIGPGLSKGPAARTLLGAVLDFFAREPYTQKPLIIDADGLNLLAEYAVLADLKLSRNVVLTPHPGELARLLGISTQEAVSNLDENAKELCRRSGAICVCKDARTRIAVPKSWCENVTEADCAVHSSSIIQYGDACQISSVQRERYWCNLTGNSGMAVGGSGDVLTGVIAGLAAQGLDAHWAAVLGVWLHGAAGDTAAREKGSRSMTASDLLDGIAKALIMSG